MTALTYTHRISVRSPFKLSGCSIRIRAWQRYSCRVYFAECLECIGHLLETYGSTVMSPTSGAALKELARHIGDRDNAVRSAALNCVASAYFLEGEKVYKMIGQVSVAKYYTPAASPA